MVFIGGPRQCGKTTLAKALIPEFKNGLYLNWDDDVQRNEILKRKWPADADLIIFDEFHKYGRWKNWIKGLYDTQKEKHRFVVTGSARLDVYGRGGDSLLGRYHYWRLHPFTLSELPKGVELADGFQRLMSIGGFPEPFLENNPTQARRWRKERLDRVIRDDVRDLEKIRDINRLSLLVDLLRTRVGGPVVIQNLAEDLQVTAPTVKHWLDVLEKMYLIFLVHPYSKNMPRALRKPPKVYFYDTGDVDGDVGARFENLVATHLLKSMHLLEDRDGFRYSLCYLRDKEGHEVDFALFKERNLVELIEVKWQDDSISKDLRYYTNKLNPPIATQIVGELARGYEHGGIRVVPAIDNLNVLDRDSLILESTSCPH